jgi:hypothetical protein
MTDPSGPPPTGPWSGPGRARPGDTTRTERIDALAAYFRTNAAGFTKEALGKAAADAGYEPLEIAAAWAVTAEAVPARGAAMLVPGLVAIAFLVGTYGVSGVLAAIPQTSGLGVVAFGLSLVLGILAWLRFRDTRPDLANAFKIGVVLVIVLPVVIGLVALGVCIVALSGMRVGG